MFMIGFVYKIEDFGIFTIQRHTHTQYWSLLCRVRLNQDVRVYKRKRERKR